MPTSNYAVTGLTCEHCVRAVTGELEKLPGVTSVIVGLIPGGTSHVTVTSDTPLPEDSVAGALDEAGDYHLARL